ncbi:MAG: prepilin-type N-terminal cleavage/methylation domain-containing protein [Sedimentisphaerales bacterium]
MKTRKGFTLIELLLVVLILAVLASIVVPRITASTADAKTSKCNANWANLTEALELYAVKNDGAYPASQALFNSNILNSLTYFPHGAPVCPYGTTYTYVSTAGQETVVQHSH